MTNILSNGGLMQIAEMLLNGGLELLQRDRVITPMAFLFDDDGKGHVVPLDFSDRQRQLQNLRMAAKVTQATKALIIADAFVSNNANGLAPSSAPDRRDAIQVYGEESTGRFVIVQEYEVKDGKHVLGRKYSIDPIDGIMTDILERDPEDCD